MRSAGGGIAAFGAALREAKLDRLRRRRALLAVLGLGAALGLTIIAAPRPLLVWNASASAPVGLYAIGAPYDLAAGDMVIARVPPAWRKLAADRRYIPEAVPLVKRVAAAPGSEVCAHDTLILIDGRQAAIRLRRDPHGRTMPWWEGCELLRDGRVFLLTESPTSFDGRYFGPVTRSQVIGRATALWVR